MKSWNLVLPSPSTQVETAWNDICPTLEVEENTVAYANRKKSCAVYCRILKKYLRARIGFPVFLPPPLFYLKFPGISIPRGEERRRKRASSLPRRLPGPQETKRGKYSIYTSWSEGRPHGPETVLDFDFSPHLLSQNCNAQKRPNQSWSSTRLCHCLCRVRY